MKKIIEVRVIPRAKKRRIERFNKGIKVYVVAPAEGGRANKELITQLSEYFNVNKKNIRIIKGECQKNKLIEITDEFQV